MNSVFGSTHLSPLLPFSASFLLLQGYHLPFVTLFWRAVWCSVHEERREGVCLRGERELDRPLTGAILFVRLYFNQQFLDLEQESHRNKAPARHHAFQFVELKKNRIEIKPPARRHAFPRMVVQGQSGSRQLACLDSKQQSAVWS